MNPIFRNRDTKIDYGLAQEIRKRYETGRFFQRDIAKKYGIAQSMVSLIINRKCWPKPNLTPMERYLSQVLIGDGCWEWLGQKETTGYGRLRVNGERLGAHQLAYKLFCGEIKSGMLICHHCDNPPCVRPSHLFLGTSADNQIDASLKGRRPKGEEIRQSKLSARQVEEIRLRYKSDIPSHRKLASLYGVDRRTIQRIVNRVWWKHV